MMDSSEYRVGLSIRLPRSEDLIFAEVISLFGGSVMQKVALISVVLDDPQKCQRAFNDTLAESMHLIKGQMTIPMPDSGLSLVSIVALGTMDDLDRLTNKLGRIDGVSVKTAMSKKDF